MKSILNSGYFPTKRHATNYIAYMDRQSPIFDEKGEEISVGGAQEGVLNTGGTVWHHVYSLTAADCARLGVDRDYMKNLMILKRDAIAKAYNITPKNIRVVCSWHNKDFHPHLHFVMYSTDSREGYIPHANKDEIAKKMNTPTRKVKSTLTNEIFKNDLQELKVVKGQNRDALNAQLNRLVSADYLVPDTIKKKFDELGVVLRSTKGKHTYKYLPPEVKAQVDDLLRTIITDDPTLRLMYEEYMETQQELILTYASDDEILEDKFKALENSFYHPFAEEGRGTGRPEVTRHNIIINAADQQAAAKQSHRKKDKLESKEYTSSEEYPDDFQEAYPTEAAEVPPELIDRDDLACSKWEIYRKGKHLADRKSEDYFPKKAVLYLQVAEEKGIAWASYQLGRLYSSEGELFDLDLAEKQFIKCVSMSDKKDVSAAMALYRLGRLYMADGEKHNMDAAIDSFASSGTDWSHYCLGRIYSEKGSPYYDIQQAVKHLSKAENLECGSAAYKLGKILSSDEYGVQDVEAAHRHFEKGATLKDDLCDYSAAVQHLKGEGCRREILAAQTRLEQLAERLPEPDEASKMQNNLREWCEARITQSYSALGKWYLNPDEPQYAPESAYTAFEEAAQRGSLYARYKVAVMMEKGIGCKTDVAQARQEYEIISRMTAKDEYEETIIRAARARCEYREKSAGYAVQNMLFKLMDSMLKDDDRANHSLARNQAGNNLIGRKQNIRSVQTKIGEERNISMMDY